MKYCIGLLFCLLPFIAFGASQTDTLAHYAAQLSEVKTLTSDFVEEKHLALLTQPIESQGTLAFDKSAQKLRWQYQKPFTNGFIIEGPRVYRLQDGQKKPVQNTMGRIMASQMLVWLTLDFENLQKNYDIALKGQQIIFTPRAQNHQVVKQITVWLDEKNPRLVTQVKMEEPSGDFVLWKFLHTQLNPPLAPEVFP